MASRFRKRFLGTSAAKVQEKNVPDIVTHRKDFLSQHSFRDLNAKPTTSNVGEKKENDYYAPQQQPEAEDEYAGYKLEDEPENNQELLDPYRKALKRTGKTGNLKQALEEEKKKEPYYGAQAVTDSEGSSKEEYYAQDSSKSEPLVYSGYTQPKTDVDINSDADITEETSSDVPYRNWDAEFQALLKQPDSLDKFQKLSNLGRDFIYTAKTYGRIIISELCLPDEQKNVKPQRSIGGIAGGTKYIAQGILFKLVVDQRKLYHGDHWAMKAASAELRGAMCYHNCHIPDLLTPLMAIIDYRGFRLLAIALVPIGDGTLVYGSSDAGKNVYADDATVNEKMKQAALKLNLKPHVVKKQIYSAVDVEVHRSKKDPKSFYVIDCARVMPPEAPSKTSREGSHLYYFLRPELLKTNPCPISSDVFSRFALKDPDNKNHNQEAREAVKRLYFNVIPNFAKTIDTFTPNMLHSWLTPEKFHRAGINLRHIGLVRLKTVNPTAQNIILTEIIARVFKNILRTLFRDKLRDLKTPSEQPYRDLVLGFVNESVLRNAKGFWYGELKKHMLDQFPFCLNPEEQKNDYDIRVHVDWPLLVQRFQDLTSIKFSRKAEENIIHRAMDGNYALFPPDVKKVGVRVSHLSIIYHAEAKLLFMKAAMFDTNERGDTDWLWELADEAFESAISSSTDSQLMLCEWGSMLFKHAKRIESSEVLAHNNQQLLIRAAEKFEIAHAISPIQEPNVLVEWAEVLCSLGWISKLESESEDLQALRLSLEQSDKPLPVSDRFFRKAALIIERVLKQIDKDKETAKESLTPKYENFTKMFKQVIEKQGEVLGVWLRMAFWSEALTRCLLEKFKQHKITTIDLSNCGNHLRESHLKIILGANPKDIKKINLSRCDSLDDKCLNEIAVKQPNIEFLDVSYCVKITAMGMFSLTNLTPKLKQLLMVGSKISEIDLVHIATANKKKLERFEISNSSAVEQIMKDIPKCAFVKLVGPQLNFDLKAILQEFEVGSADLEDTEIKDGKRVGKLKSLRKEVVIKKLIDVDQLIYVTEEEARTVIQNLLKLNDPKLVPVYGLYMDEKNSIQVMTERQKAPTLDAHFRKSADISFYTRMRVAYEIATACKWLVNSKDVVIPNLKPSNIFITLEEAHSIKIGSCYSADAILKTLKYISHGQGGLQELLMPQFNKILEEIFFTSRVVAVQEEAERRRQSMEKESPSMDRSSIDRPGTDRSSTTPDRSSTSSESPALQDYHNLAKGSSGHVHTEAHEKKQYELVKNLTYELMTNNVKTFDEIIAKMEDILFGATGKLRELWGRLNKSWKTPWGFFWKELIVVGCPIYSTWRKYAKFEPLLKELLASPDEDPLERFYKILYWFSPFDDITKFLEKVNNICKEPWFFGFLGVEESMALLQKSNTSKCFLVRFSSKQWGSYVVALNVSNPKNKWKITQVRILNDGGHFKIEDHHLRDTAFNSLQDCIATLKTKSIVSEPCTGSPFTKLSYDKLDSSAGQNTYEDFPEGSNASYSYSTFQREAKAKRETL